MISEYSKKDNLLTIKLTEEIDQHTTDKIRRKLDNEIERFIPRKVIFDFSNISFMDSSGIGMVLGRYKLIKMLGGNLEIINVNKLTKKIFDMSGVTRIISIKQKVNQNENKNKNQNENRNQTKNKNKEVEEEEENNEGVI